MPGPSDLLVTLRFFEGPAGSGKTTSIFVALDEQLVVSPLLGGQKVLALTKMHGSRRRLQARLAEIPALRGKFECNTIDSFAWRLLNRWKSLARNRFGPEPDEESYEEVCNRVGQLLAEEYVRHWVSTAFPIVLIDELQDSKGGQLEIVRQLVSGSSCISAADEFQDLESAQTNQAVAWARTASQPTILTQVHRTQVAGLLAGALALRQGQRVPTNGAGLSIECVPAAALCAWYLAKTITAWYGHGSLAIISPVRQGTAAFVKDSVERLASSKIGKPPREFGPFQVPWEASQDDEEAEFLGLLDLHGGQDARVRISELIVPPNFAGSSPLRAWIDWQKKIGGADDIAFQELVSIVKALFRKAKNFRRTSMRRIEAMTIHQAKNREFESVILLWPREVGGTGEAKRRLLYNAITRARRQALVLVQDPSKNRKRLTVAPFQ